MAESLMPSELKTILHSKRSNIYYLQYCRVLVNSGRVEYVTEEGKQSLYWNIPVANTTVVMLVTGTSVTQAAMREFARAGVLLGFCAGGGTPLYAANEVEVNVSWRTSQSEYRPTEYLQHWVSFWFDEQKRLAAAVAFQQVRTQQIRKNWFHAAMIQEKAFQLDVSKTEAVLKRFELSLPQAFIAAMNGEDEQEFRQGCLRYFQRVDALDIMIETVQNVAREISHQE